MILTHGSNSIGSGDGNGIDIDGIHYDVVNINGTLWITHDLINKLTGITYAPDDKWYLGAACKYYNNDEATYGPTGQNRGLLYNAASRSVIQAYLDANLPGWRIPSLTDYANIVSFCGGSSSAQMKCCAPELWPDLTGITNETGFSAIPTGRVNSGSFDYVDKAFYMTDGTGISFYIAFIDSEPHKFDAVGNSNMKSNYDYSALRLCKDA